MRLNACLLLLAALTQCKPTMNRAEKIQLRFGENVNVTAAELIIAEDAKLLGLKEQDYFDQCTINLHAFWRQLEPTLAEKFLMRIDMKYIAEFAGFNSTDEVMPHLSASLPNSYKFITKRVEIINHFFAPVDEIGKKFLRNCSLIALAKIVEASQQPLWDKYLSFAFGGIQDDLLSEVKPIFENLPEETLSNFDKLLCEKTSQKISKALNQDPPVEEPDASVEQNYNSLANEYKPKARAFPEPTPAEYIYIADEDDRREDSI